uniref:Anaphase-promoting complex subunit 4 n=1 Tax=Sphaeramia orbicularis TaxID=375764 RepID=A0A672Y6U5_9TELE
MPAFRQVGEKQLPNPVLCMAWSPKRDLIALANTTGELLLHRLASFQRVWSLPPSEYTGKDITALAWRPDGICLLIVSYSYYIVLILQYWPLVLETLSRWSCVVTGMKDESKLFLPKLPTLPKRYEEKSDEIMNLLGEVRLNILALGGDTGFVELYAYGMYKIAALTGVSGTCRSLSLSSDLKSLSIIAEVRSADNDPEICYSQLDTGLLSDCLPEVTRMARKFTHISTLLQYLHLSLTCMCEAWEDILMQMDLRLTKFVQEKNTSTQGLKKLGQSIESSYSSIQKLVISHLQSGSEALLYHLSEVKGMSLWKQKFEPLGLDSTAIEGAITAVGSFSLKANELLQVIDKSMKNFKAFFRWLYVAMLRMCEEHVPPELNKMTQKDISFVADFLSEHFSENEELFDRKGKYFNVERVGQYLKDEDEDLVSPPNNKGNQWLKFLQESSHLKESPLLFPAYPQKSLHFVKRMMEGVIEQCLQKPAVSFMLVICINYISCLFCRWNDKKAKMHYVVFSMPEISPCKLYLLRRATDPNSTVSASHLRDADNADCAANTIYCDFPFRPHLAYSCLDARFYDDEMLTVVLQGPEEEHSGRVLGQLPLASTLSCETEFIWKPNQRLDQQSDAIPSQGLVLGNQWRELENMKAQFIAVNGIRKVACVLSSNLRHIRVFEMDVEDEDEEGAESQNATADQDVLDTTMSSQGQDEDGKEVKEQVEAAEHGGDEFQKTEDNLESEEALELS